jgi:hypothetical protein
MKGSVHVAGLRQKLKARYAEYENGEFIIRQRNSLATFKHFVQSDARGTNIVMYEFQY